MLYFSHSGCGSNEPITGPPHPGPNPTPRSGRCPGTPKPSHTLYQRSDKSKRNAFKCCKGREGAHLKACNYFKKSFPLISTPWGCRQKSKSSIPGADCGGIYNLNVQAPPTRASFGQTLPRLSTRRSARVPIPPPQKPCPLFQPHPSPNCLWGKGSKPRFPHSHISTHSLTPAPKHASKPPQIFQSYPREQGGRQGHPRRRDTRFLSECVQHTYTLYPPQ